MLIRIWIRDRIRVLLLSTEFLSVHNNSTTECEVDYRFSPIRYNTIRQVFLLSFAIQATSPGLLENGEVLSAAPPEELFLTSAIEYIPSLV